MSSPSTSRASSSETEELLLLLTDAGLDLRNIKANVSAASVEVESLLTMQGITVCEWCDDGSAFSLIQNVDDKWNVQVMSTSCEVLFKYEAEKRIRRVALAPRGNFVYFCFAPSDIDGPNIFLYRTKNISPNPEPVARFNLKNFIDYWPSIRISKDETFLVRNGGSGLKLFIMPTVVGAEPKQISKNGQLISQPTEVKDEQWNEPLCFIPTSISFICFTLSSEHLHPETKGTMVYLGVVDHPKAGSNGRARVYSSDNTEQPISSCTVVCESADAYFSTTQDVLYIEAKRDVDADGKSYYGFTTLHSLSTINSRHNNIVIGKKGPLNAIATRPGTSHVVISHGPLPGKIKLLSNHGMNMNIYYGQARRNYLAIDPHGKYLFCAGLGSLPGDMDTYEIETGKVLSQIRIEDIVSAKWMLNGGMVILSTTSPRLRVDNKIMIMRHTGDVIFRENFTQLLQCSPQPKYYEDVTKAYPSQALKPSLPKKKEVVKSYVPPSQRNRGGAKTPGLVQQQPVKAPAVKPAEPTTPKPQKDKISFIPPY